MSLYLLPERVYDPSAIQLLTWPVRPTKLSFFPALGETHEKINIALWVIHKVVGKMFSWKPHMAFLEHPCCSFVPAVFHIVSFADIFCFFYHSPCTLAFWAFSSFITSLSPLSFLWHFSSTPSFWNNFHIIPDVPCPRHLFLLSDPCLRVYVTWALWTWSACLRPQRKCLWWWRNSMVTC